MKKKVQLGDVYSSTLPNGMYGAVRVVNMVNEGKYMSYLVYTTTYMKENKPTIEDTELLEIFTENSAIYGKQPALDWLDKEPSKSVEYVGNIPLNEDEMKLESSSYGGNFDVGCATPIYWDWVRNNNIDIEQEETKVNAGVNENLPSEREYVSRDEEFFWSMISKMDWKQGDEWDIADSLVDHLAKKSKGKIKVFEETLAYLLYQLDTKQHAEQIGEHSYKTDNDFFSEDLFLYARCYVVAKGKNVFQRVLQNPLEMPKDKEFEALLSIAEEAYEQKADLSFDYVSEYDYETYSNDKGWA
ncbi:DUF4240 domain-containing protein [Terribacillus saccharophilus]|nr:DUF4240 domain-containing protein [Terribacillus goriensis]